MTELLDINFMRIYEGLRLARVYINDDIYSLKRGKGLGMMNYMYTVIYMTIVKILELESIHTGDDVVIASPEGSNDIYTNIVLCNNLHKTYEEFFLEVSKKKPIISKSFIFLEEAFNVPEMKFEYRKRHRGI